MPGETLYEIADLSHVWLHTYVYEQDIADIRTGQHARITLPSRPGKTYDAEVMFLFPNVEEASRTLEIRLEADNPDMELRPDMWANADIDVTLGEGLTVPASAVIDTGQRRVVFVAGDNGHFEPRDISVTGRNDDYYIVSDGVTEGEPVVTRALFLVDSESQLKAAISGMK
jgi:Cu(I)/Ag(I) efflux system membrane fusion protein